MPTLKMPAWLGQHNRKADAVPGALTSGMDLLSMAAPDGYTIGMGPIGALAISPSLAARRRNFPP